MIRLLLLTVLVVAAPAAAQSVRIDRTATLVGAGTRPLPVRAVGRVKAVSQPGGATFWLHQWPGVYFETRFRGDTLILRFDDAANEYRLWIDRLTPIALRQPGRADVQVSGLPNGLHAARLEKVTESTRGIGAFGGFHGPRGSRGEPIPARLRRIEFVGDSSMTGYGARSSTRQCTREEVRLRTDTQQAYPALVAKAFQADYQVNAISSRGLIRNYKGALPGATMPAVYPFLFFNPPHAPYSGAGWQPQIIFVKLNADFASPLQPGEKWSGFPELFTAYVAAFGRFIQTLHRRSPSAVILLWWFDAGQAQDPAEAQLIENGRRSLLRTAAAAGVRRLDFLAPTGLALDQSACDYHYSLPDHRKLAGWLTAYLKAHPDYWNTPGPKRPSNRR